MTSKFNALEIFEMAEQIERNGGKFYRTAIDKVKNNDLKKLLQELVDWEADHEKTFRDLKKQYAEDAQALDYYDPDSEPVYFLKAVADGHIFLANDDPTKLIGNDPSAVDLIKLAITFERDSIVFYLGMKDLVSEKIGKSQVNRILEEERSHVVILSQKLKDLG